MVEGSAARRSGRSVQGGRDKVLGMGRGVIWERHIQDLAGKIMFKFAPLR